MVKYFLQIKKISPMCRHIYSVEMTHILYLFNYFFDPIKNCSVFFFITIIISLCLSL